MKKKRVARTHARTKHDQERDGETRARFQQRRPSLDELVATGEYTPPMKQGEYLSVMELSAAFKKCRQNKKLSLTQVAKRSGIDKAAISRLENGQVENPTIATLQRLASSLGMTLQLKLKRDLAAR